MGRTCTLAARGGQVCLGSSWPSPSSPGQGGAEVLLTSMTGGRDPQGPGRRAVSFMSLCLALSALGKPDRAASTGTWGSCPSSAPHGPAEKSLGSATTEGTLAKELPPCSCCGRALAVQWIRRDFCSDSGSCSPFFSFPLLPAPQCAIWVISTRLQSRLAADHKVNSQTLTDTL